jgi:hypothetical protein
MEEISSCQSKEKSWEERRQGKLESGWRKNRTVWTREVTWPVSMGKDFRSEGEMAFTLSTIHSHPNYRIDTWCSSKTGPLYCLM